MATTIDRLETEDEETPVASFPNSARDPLANGVLTVLKFLASLKITVVLFAMAIFIIFVGTLAQTQFEIWTVVRDYFRSGWVWVPFSVFFPKSFFPGLGEVHGSFPFLGGWAIGGLMAVNLVAAHLVRFKIQAKDSRLWIGLGVIAAGCLITAGVVLGGARSNVELAGLLDPSMRILWQLLQGGFAGLVLLAGCWLVFGKRAGVVLLHAGIGLMMFSELLVGTSAVEAQMHIVEGDTVNYVQDIRATELAVIDTSDPKTDKVVAIPKSMLKDGEVIELPKGIDLPFDIRIVRYLQNSELDQVKPGGENPATAGVGLELVAKAAKAGVGTDSSGAVDQSAVYVQLFKRGTSQTQSLGTYLLSTMQSQWNDSRERTGLAEAELRAVYRVGPFVLKLTEPTVIEIDGKTYKLALRFKRIYKDYAITLNDVHTEKYLGTDTPKDYSSIVRLTVDSPDPAQRVERDGIRIWMNNPLRFAGETFYQSSVGADPITHEETTGLQVVTNSSWMIPYVSCMIVAVGMLSQFVIALLRFLNRIRAAAPKIAVHTLPELVLVASVVVCFAAMVGYFALPPRVPLGEMNLYEAGKIPVVEGGRVKPLDSLARNKLLMMSNRETFKDAEGKRQSAVRWLFDVMAGKEGAETARVLRIDHPELVERLGLDWRESHLYSVKEILGRKEKGEDFMKDLAEAHKKPADQLNDYERRCLDLERRIGVYDTTSRTMHRPDFAEPDAKLRQLAKERGGALLERFDAMEAEMKTKHPALAIPVLEGEGTSARYEWKPMVPAFWKEYVGVQLLEGQPQPTIAAWDAILSAYLKDDADGFNKAVEKYQTLLAHSHVPELTKSASNFEAYFNHFSPLHLAWVLYVITFVLAALGWLGWTGPINRAAFWFCLLTFGLHTFALAARIYISGRPPVTNLYSTAPFIGWGCVLLALAFEPIFRLGIGNVVASIAGFATLFIASKLAADGDTFTVLQAVLDTQFWLATHVVVINLGYAATLLSGALGVMYIARGLATPTLSPQVDKDMTRMIYGTLCFGIFFSFVGTVLGGLWADDSWGRFWGWDPKENGALMIVLWNALVLHARWDGMVKGRGMAVLAVGGNIITAWSWFGVNELGVGLHSYGVSEGRKWYLAMFCLSQIVVMALGALPKEFWWSYQARKSLA